VLPKLDLLRDSPISLHLTGVLCADTIGEAREVLRTGLERGIPTEVRLVHAGPDGRFRVEPGKREELEAFLAAAGGDGERGLALAKEAAADEDGMSFEFGPPAVVKPAHELLGEMLLKAGNAAAARAEFERSLAHNPERALSLLGLARAASKSGNRTAADEAYKRLAAIWHRADADLPELAEVRAPREVSAAR